MAIECLPIMNIHAFSFPCMKCWDILIHSSYCWVNVMEDDDTVEKTYIWWQQKAWWRKYAMDIGLIIITKNLIVCAFPHFTGSTRNRESTERKWLWKDMSYTSMHIPLNHSSRESAVELGLLAYGYKIIFLKNLTTPHEREQTIILLFQKEWV